MTTRRVEESTDGSGRVVREEVVYESDDVTRDEVLHDEVVEEHAVSDSWGVTRNIVRTIGLVAIALLAVVETLLAFRLGFLAAAANPANDFVNFIYDATGWLVDPFEGIIANDAVGGGGVFEWATVIAMAVYFVATILFVILLTALTSFPSTTRCKHSVAPAQCAVETWWRQQVPPFAFTVAQHVMTRARQAGNSELFIQ
jgi:hypothetical protein